MLAFEEVEHTADVALRVRGRDLAELLVNAAHGLSSLLCPPGGYDAEVCPPAAEHTHQIEVTAPDAEGLLVEWLSELLYLAERERFVGRDFAVDSLTPTRLRAVARGGAVARPARHIKAVTYHQLAIVPAAEGLETTVVFDV